MDFKEEFCDEADLAVPVVAVKIIPDKEGGRTKRDVSPVVVLSTATVAATTTASALTTTPQETIVTVRAKVTYIYRQGTEVEATMGQKIHISSSDDDGMCGIASRLQEGKQYILKMPRSGVDTMSVYMCDFFIDRNSDRRLDNPHKFFKKVKCGKKKKDKKEKAKKDKGKKDKKSKGKKNKGN